jgi:hypothetical protein
MNPGEQRGRGGQPTVGLDLLRRRRTTVVPATSALRPEVSPAFSPSRVRSTSACAVADSRFDQRLLLLRGERLDVP